MDYKEDIVVPGAGREGATMSPTSTDADEISHIKRMIAQKNDLINDYDQRIINICNKLETADDTQWSRLQQNLEILQQEREHHEIRVEILKKKLEKLESKIEALRKERAVLKLDRSREVSLSPFPSEVLRKITSSNLRNKYGVLCCSFLQSYNALSGVNNALLRRFYDIDNLDARYVSPDPYRIRIYSQLKYCHAAIYKETEQTVVQCNLEIILSSMKKILPNENYSVTCEVSLEKNTPSKPYLCFSTSEPDGAIYCQIDDQEQVMLLVAEPKSVESGPFDCFAELIFVERRSVHASPGAWSGRRRVHDSLLCVLWVRLSGFRHFRCGRCPSNGTDQQS